MLRSPKKPFSPGKSLHTGLLAACRAGDQAAAEAACAQLTAILLTKPDAQAVTVEKTKLQLALSASEPSGWTALLYAARNGWSGLAEQLLAALPALATSNAKLSSSGNTGESYCTTAASST